MRLAPSRVSGSPGFAGRVMQVAVVAGAALIRASRLLGFLALCLVSGVSFAADEVAIPPLTARVTDLTATLSAEQKAQLEGTLAQIEAAKGSQVAVLMLPTTKPETIEQYGIRLAEAWKVGRKGVDDGVIVIVAKDDRATRIEVGYGLEGAIPDAIAKRIVSETMIPRFKQGDFFGGIEAAVDAIGKIITGEELPAPVSTRQTGASNTFDQFGNLIPFAFVFVFIVGGILRALLGRLPGAGVGSAIAFAGGWLLMGSLIGAVVIAIITFLFTLAGGGGRGGLGGFGGMGGFGGGGGSGGGFSGGGGGFGGGGSSGSW